MRTSASSHAVHKVVFPFHNWDRMEEGAPPSLDCTHPGLNLSNRHCGRMRNTEVLLLLGTKPSGWEVLRKGSPAFLAVPVWGGASTSLNWEGHEREQSWFK